eukprot:516804_1
MFFHSDYNYEWLDLHVIKSLFPNIERIDIWRINLSSKIMDDVLKHLQDVEYATIVQLDIVAVDEHSQLSVQEAIEQYTEAFQKHSLFITCDVGERILTVNRCSKLHFALKVIDGFLAYENSYFVDINGEITLLIDSLLKTYLQNRIKSKRNQPIIEDAASTLFKTFCMKKTTARLDWKEIQHSSKSYLFKLLLHSRYDWIKLDVFVLLFPNIEKILFYTTGGFDNDEYRFLFSSFFNLFWGDILFKHKSLKTIQIKATHEYNTY